MRRPLVGYIAVKALGYWADTFVTVDDGVDHARRAARGGRARRDHREHAAVRADRLRSMPTATGPGQALTAPGARSLTASACRCTKRRLQGDWVDATLVEDGVDTLQVGAADANSCRQCFAVRDRACRGEGVEVLVRPPSPVEG